MATIIRDLVHLGVITCSERDTVRTVARILAEHRIHGLIVVDETELACGIITQSDVIQCFKEDIDRLLAGDIMTPGLRTITLDEPIDSAIEVMTARGIHFLPVVSTPASKHPIGIISRSDIINRMAAPE